MLLVELPSQSRWTWEMSGVESWPCKDMSSRATSRGRWPDEEDDSDLGTSARYEQESFFACKWTWPSACMSLDGPPGGFRVVGPDVDGLFVRLTTFLCWSSLSSPFPSSANSPFSPTSSLTAFDPRSETPGPKA